MFSSQPCSFLSFNFLQGDFCILAKWDEIKGNSWNSIILTWKKIKKMQISREMWRMSIWSEKVLKGYLILQFFFFLTFAHTFLIDSGTKLCRRFFNNELVILCFNTSMSFESVCFTKTIRIIQKIFEKKEIMDTVLCGSSLCTFQWKKKYEKLNFCWCKRSKCGKYS